MVFIVTIIIILLIIWCRECDFNLMIIYENIFMIAIASTILLIIITMIDSNEKCRKVKMEKSWWKEAALDNAASIDEPQATSVSRCCSTKQANGRANATTWRRDTDLTKNAIKLKNTSRNWKIASEKGSERLNCLSEMVTVLVLVLMLVMKTENKVRLVFYWNVKTNLGNKQRYK